MNWHAAFESEMSGRLCVALVHSLWQAALLALVVGVTDRLRRNRSVEWAYVVYVGALTASLAALPITFVLLTDAAATHGATVPQAERQRLAAPKSIDATTAAPAMSTPDINEPLTSPTMRARASTGTRHRPSWRQFAPELAAAYTIGVSLMLVRLAMGVAAAETLRRTSRAITNGPTVNALRRLAQQWRLGIVPVLAQAEQIAIPTLIGLLRPTILLPTSALAGLSVEELELILAHELAHVRRRDMWVNLLQRLTEALLFFNPAVWHLSRRVAQLREDCCDELACGSRTAPAAAVRINYATALLRVVELARPPSAANSQLAALSAAGRSPSDLRRRVARLLGEPVRAPLGVSRGSMLVAMSVVLAVVLTPRWLRSQDPAEPTPPNGAIPAYPPPSTDADAAVAAARARTFGLQLVPRILMRQSSWNATVSSMQKASEASIKLLWQARGKDVDQSMRTATAYTQTVAWQMDKLLVQTDMQSQGKDLVAKQEFTQSRFWDGAEGWLGEKSAQQKNIYRYASLDKLMDDSFALYFPQWAAAGNRLPWGGPPVVLTEYAVDPELTRYKFVGNETIDGAPCDVYDGPARSERLWIDRPMGLVKAMCRNYVHNELPNYYSDLIRDVAGRTFADANEYREWRDAQPPDVQAKLSAHWAAAHWPGSEPGNLSVFSDYREIVPGVHWPMHCERIVVQPTGRGADGPFCYYRSEIAITEVNEKFVIGDVAVAARPRAGDSVTDRRKEPEVTYRWSDSLDESQVEGARLAKLEAKRQADAATRKINETPINSVADAIGIITDGPKTDPSMVWARAIKYLVDHKDEALPAVIKELDGQTQDRPISKLAFALRAIGDPRAVPALIRALPRTLLPPRSDYGLRLEEDAELLRFMQQHDQTGKVRGGRKGWFDYGRAFREVVSALEGLTQQNFGEMELNWIHLSESPAQRAQQRVLFDRVARRWAQWWEAEGNSLVNDPAYAAVNLPPLSPEATSLAGRQQPPAGPGVKLIEGSQGWIVQSVQESAQRTFVDLDTMREGGWPASLAPVQQSGVDSTELLTWAREQGYDLVGVSFTPPGEDKPLYSLKPLDMHVWKITPQEHRRLAEAMAGREPYPLSTPVELMVPRREVKPPFDPQYGGDAFLFVTREGTAGVIRMTAQATEPVVAGYASGDDQFSPTGFYRGAKVSFATMAEPDSAPESSRRPSAP